MPRVLILTASLAAVAACATPNPPTVTSRDVDRAFVEAARVSALPVTAPIDVPTGTVTYDGQIGADLSGDTLGSIVGDMRMDVGFASNRISGSISDINLIDQSGRPDQRLGGTLQIAGVENSGALDAGASGEISAVDNNGQALEADMFLDLRGSVRDDRGFGDAVYGSVTGEARGDFDIDVDGVFFGERR
ncbi:hypothetical protein [Yoonia sp. SS1-5]|uniref:Transferrin-binding protein B C-lobe/N-lobe beta barrel domain-containing protein n=1 Tax=Yoonia rhodophyticola TaxID=3137370 RepID=A0AAN0NLW9_9RHOB